MKYTMQLIRFRKSGKYYDHISFKTDKEYMYQISDEMRCTLHTEVYDYMATGYLCTEENPSESLGEHPNGFPSLVKGD